MAKAMNLTELAHAYGISTRTMRRWLKQVPQLGRPPTGSIYTPAQVKLIVDHLGPMEND